MKDSHNCAKCICITCEKIDTCSYHNCCTNGYFAFYLKEYVTECKDYVYSKENDEYFNG